MVFSLLLPPGFDFNRCISQGVPYMPVRTRDFQLLQVRRSLQPPKYCCISCWRYSMLHAYTCAAVPLAAGHVQCFFLLAYSLISITTSPRAGQPQQ
jgi:hypothetical protein